MLWDCVKCGCSAIAHDLGFCPQCYEEKNVPKTNLAGASNQHAAPGETGYNQPAESPAEPAATAVTVSAGEPVAQPAEAPAASSEGTEG